MEQALVSGLFWNSPSAIHFCDIIICIYTYLLVLDLEPGGTEGLTDICAVQGEV